MELREGCWHMTAIPTKKLLPAQLRLHPAAIPTIKPVTKRTPLGAKASKGILAPNYEWFPDKSEPSNPGRRSLSFGQPHGTKKNLAKALPYAVKHHSLHLQPASSALTTYPLNYLRHLAVVDLSCSSLLSKQFTYIHDHVL